MEDQAVLRPYRARTLFDAVAEVYCIGTSVVPVRSTNAE